MIECDECPYWVFCERENRLFCKEELLKLDNNKYIIVIKEVKNDK